MARRIRVASGENVLLRLGFPSRGVRCVIKQHRLALYGVWFWLSDLHGASHVDFFILFFGWVVQLPIALGHGMYAMRMRDDEAKVGSPYVKRTGIASGIRTQPYNARGQRGR